MKFSRSALVNLCLPLCCLSSFLGCGAENKCVPVSGKVACKSGEPCAGALVVFHPQERDRVNDPKPVGTCDAQGQFVLTTHVPDDGAQPGEYGVTIVWIAEATKGKKTMTLFGESGGGGDRLGGRYGQPQAPQLSAVVAPDQPNRFEFVVE